ncbi:hypothetical protein M3Y99_01816800 [Aphelenchoides fujianensis]|nr:hypothetical protein M3Y99_01816800 [Aphelenchoides fujianensis]
MKVLVGVGILFYVLQLGSSLVKDDQPTGAPPTGEPPGPPHGGGEMEAWMKRMAAMLMVAMIASIASLLALALLIFLSCRQQRAVRKL